MLSEVHVNIQRYLCSGIVSEFWLEGFFTMYQDFLKSVNNKRHYAKKFKRTCFYGVHCVKTVRIRSFSGVYFLAFELNMVIYSPNICNQSKCEKIRTRKTPNTGSSHEVVIEDCNCSLIWKDY